MYWEAHSSFHTIEDALQGPVEESAIHDYRVNIRNNESIALSFGGECGYCT